ncbi:mariner transposase [Trichonephila clavipes]|nr:mariner transposase [Trichonephila clavipes]
MKHRSIISFPRHKNNQNNELEREQAPKKAKTAPSAGKVMALFLWDACEIIFTDYLEKGKTIYDEYCMSLLQRSSEEIKQKRPHFKKKKLFHEDNAHDHKSFVAIANINELLPHAPFLSDLAPSDYFLSLNLKKWLSDERFSYNEMSAINGYFVCEEQDSSY